MDLLDLIWFVASTSLLYIVYKIIMYGFQRTLKGREYSIDFINGIKLVLRVLFVFLILLFFFTLLGVESQIIIPISSISGVIIGFSTTEIVGQAVGGVFLMIRQPFTVHDLVRIGGVEGIVLEIGINRVLVQKFDGTLVKIPNKKIMDTEIKNYTIKLTEELKNKILYPEKEKKDLITLDKAEKNGLDLQDLKNFLGNVTDFMFEPEVTRYTFDFEIDFGVNPYEVLAKMEKICKKFTSVYRYRPKCFIVDLGYRARFRVRIYCTNPRTIMQNHNDFLENIAADFYGKKGGDSK